jgi:TrmH family RNA methyltransferase
VLIAPETVEAFNPKVVRGAMGAHFRLPILEADWAAIADRVRGLPVYVAEADASRSYTSIDWTQPGALIVGGEAEGTSAAAAKLATVRISIPLAREVESLNAGVAASVIVFEAQRQRQQKTDRS